MGGGGGATDGRLQEDTSDENEHCHQVSDKFWPVGIRRDVTAGSGEWGGRLTGDFKTRRMNLSIAIR